MNDMAVKILLTRHGETENAHQICYNGKNNVGLSENGIAQIELLAHRLEKEPVKAIYTSHLKRSIHSGTIIAQKHSLSTTKNPDLSEISYGRWEGMPYEEIKEKYGEEMDQRICDPVHYRIKDGGENLTDLSNRVVPALKKILDNHPNETIVLALHGGVNRIILGWALGLKLDLTLRIKQHFAALNIIYYYPENQEVLVELVNG